VSEILYCSRLSIFLLFGQPLQVSGFRGTPPQASDLVVEGMMIGSINMNTQPATQGSHIMNIIVLSVLSCPSRESRRLSRERVVSVVKVVRPLPHGAFPLSFVFLSSFFHVGERT